MIAENETAPARFDGATRELLRRALLHRGATLAQLLGDVLSGKDRALALLSLGVDRPGIRPEEALRKALEEVEMRRRLLVAGDDRFGRCDVCGVPFTTAALIELPWADRCQKHA